MKRIFIGFLSILFFASACPQSFGDITSRLDTVVVTAARIAQHNYKLTGNVTVITQEEIEASNAQNIPDILKEVVGTFVYDKNTTKTATLDIRGFGDTATRNILVLVNNRRINSVDISGPDLIQVPIESVERIEVIRGAGSVLYGDNAVGGVVNIITKKGKGDLSARAGAFYGSYDEQGADAEVSGEYKKLSYYFDSKYFDKRGYRDNSDVLTKDFHGRVAYQLSDYVSMDFNMGVHKDTYDLPGGLDESELITLGRRGSADQGNMADTKDEFYQLTFDVTPWLHDVYWGNFIVDVHYRKRHVFDSFAGYNADRDIRTKGVSAKYIFDRTLFGKEIHFVTGLDYDGHENDILGSGSNTDNLTISKEELGVFGFLEYELFENFFVNGGTRYHRADYAFSQRNVAVDEKKHPDVWVSMGGLKYEYAKGSNIHFNVQQTFRFLATDEWYSTWSGLDTSLKQQEGIQVEAGVKHNFDNKMEVSVTPYWMQTSDEIFFDPTSGFFGSNSNYDKIHRYGVEVGTKTDIHRFFDYDFLDKLELVGNYTYQRPEFSKGSNDGKIVPMVPQHQLTSGFITTIFGHYHLSFMTRYVGSRFVINDTSNAKGAAKPYYTADLKLSYERNNFEIFTDINNIFDKKYTPYVIKKSNTSNDVYPAPERNFRVGVNVKF